MVVQPNNTGPWVKGQIPYSSRIGVPASALSAAPPSALPVNSSRQQESSSKQKQRKRKSREEETEEKEENNQENANKEQKKNCYQKQHRKKDFKSIAATTAATGKSSVHTKRQATDVIVQVATFILSSRFTRRKTKSMNSTATGDNRMRKAPGGSRRSLKIGYPKDLVIFHLAPDTMRLSSPIGSPLREEHQVISSIHKMGTTTGLTLV